MKWRILKHTDGNNNTYYTVQYKKWYWFWSNYYIPKGETLWGWEIERYPTLEEAKEVMGILKENHEIRKRSKQIKTEVVEET